MGHIQMNTVYESRARCRHDIHLYRTPIELKKKIILTIHDYHLENLRGKMYLIRRITAINCH